MNLTKQPNAVSTWQERFELEAIAFGMPSKAGRIVFWGLMLDAVQDWPDSVFERWLNHVSGLYGDQVRPFYRKMHNILAQNRRAYIELARRITLTTPGQVVCKYVEES